MGQKTHPLGFRLGYSKTWKSRWYSKDNYTKFLHEDLKLRRYIKNNLKTAAISKVEIERTGEKALVCIYTGRPGVIIGTKGALIKELREKLQKLVESEVDIEIREIPNAELDAQLVAENIASQLERRMGFRRAMKKALATVMKLGAKGCKVQIKGRIGGAEMARTEQYAEGRVPLQMLRADIDYGFGEAHTIYGVVGVKVWIFHDEVLPEQIKGGDLQEQTVARKKRGRRGKSRRRRSDG
jgi:small subunit ribosomal protein S3